MAVCRRWSLLRGAGRRVLGDLRPSPPSTLKSLIAPGAKVKQFASGLAFAEGPLWLPDGRLIVSEVNGDDVVAFDAAGNQSDFRRPSNLANGHALDPDGSVVEAETGDGHAPRPDREDRRRRVRRGSGRQLQGQALQRTERPDREARRHDLVHGPWLQCVSPPRSRFLGVYRLDPKSKVVTLVTKTLCEPNGIAFSPDEKTLYVSDSLPRKLYSFPVAADDTVGPGQNLASAATGSAWTSGAMSGRQCAASTLLLRIRRAPRSAR